MQHPCHALLAFGAPLCQPRGRRNQEITYGEAPPWRRLLLPFKAPPPPRMACAMRKCGRIRGVLPSVLAGWHQLCRFKCAPATHKTCQCCACTEAPWLALPPEKRRMLPLLYRMLVPAALQTLLTRAHGRGYAD